MGKEVYKLRDIQRYCKTKIVPQPIPSIDDVTEIKADKILCQAEELLQDSDMNRLIDIIEKKVLEEDYTTLDLAAGLLRMIMGEDNEDIIEDSRPLRSLDDLGDTGTEIPAEERRTLRRQRRPIRRRRYGQTVHQYWKEPEREAGRHPGRHCRRVRNAGKMVGSIDMYDKYTFVEVPREQAEWCSRP